MIDRYELQFLSACFVLLLVGVTRKRGYAYLIFTSMLVILIGFGIKHLLFVSCITLINLILFIVNVSNPILSLACNIAYLYFYKLYGPSLIYVHGTYDISGILMVMTVKSCYLALENDGNVKKALIYLLFPPGLASGPVPKYSNFEIREDFTLSFIELFLSVIYLLIYAKTKTLDLLEPVKYKNNSFIKKLLFLYLWNFGLRTKFYFIWTFSHCCYSMFGYEDLLNFDIKKTEAAISVQEITSNWNKFVSKFLKEFIFLKYISYGKFYAILSTFTVSGFFHNYKPSTLLFFLSFLLLGKILDDFNKNFENNLIKRIQTSLFVSYFSVPFLTQSVKETFIVWKSVYFYMHIYIGICGILLLLKFIYLKLTKIKDSEKKID